jgi:hypothetical protein
MTDANPRTEVVVPQNFKHLICVNTEYQKVICIGSGCGYAKESSTKQWIRHLQGHKVSGDIAEKAAAFIGRLGWERSVGSRESIPPNGSAPQPGVEVIDGVRCRYCRRFISTDTTEIKRHWEIEKHGDTDGCLVELVRIQSWDRDNSERSKPARIYWAVDDRMKQSGRDEGGYSQAGSSEIGQGIGDIVKDDWEEVSEGEMQV